MKIEMPQLHDNEADKQIAEAGGMTEDKARDLKLAQKYVEREEHLDLAKKIIDMPEEELSKMSPIERSIFQRYALDISKEADREKLSAITKINMLDDIKQIEARWILTDLNDQKLFKEYTILTTRYDEWFGKEELYKPQLNPRDKIAAENFLMSTAGIEAEKPEQMEVTYKKDPNKVFEEKLQLEDAA